MQWVCGLYSYLLKMYDQLPRADLLNTVLWCEECNKVKY